MKYIRHINEYNSEPLYHKIDLTEFKQQFKNKPAKFDLKNIETLNNKFDQYKTIDSYVSFNDNTVSFNSSRKVFDIWKLEDEYYIVKTWIKTWIKDSGPYTYHLCDDLEGVLQYIDSEFN